ncbi:MAG: MotA/TolQ/ExbB proton channel family protein [Treponema sp.]|nr:MotA/TolQ/ExbB proton channel family protein [Treponema sp.]
MDTSVNSFSLLELFQMGGVIMWPLLAFSIAAVAITIERGFYLFYHDLKLEDLKKKSLAFIKEGNIGAGIEFLEGQNRRKLGVPVLLTLLKRNKLSEYRLEKAVETEAEKCVSSLGSGFSFLTALASISPLTGFLGTVTGMIGAFRSIAEAVDVNAQIVAAGIYEALITTVFGLIIAILAMSAHSLFSHIVDKFTSEMEAACSELIIVLAESSGAKKSGGR